MARLVPNPQELLEQLRRLVSPARAGGRDEPTSVERILDAAHAAFAESGGGATTMTRIARDARVSREWLSRQFANRDAVVVAVAQREVGRLIDGLAVRAFGGLPADEALIVAEVLVRLVATTTLAPTAGLDLHDPGELRRFATAMVPGVIAAARTPVTG